MLAQQLGDNMFKFVCIALGLMVPAFWSLALLARLARCVALRTCDLRMCVCRYLKEDGGIVNPYGTIPWLYVTIYQVRIMS